MWRFRTGSAFEFQGAVSRRNRTRQGCRMPKQLISSTFQFNGETDSCTIVAFPNFPSMRLGFSTTTAFRRSLCCNWSCSMARCHKMSHSVATMRLATNCTARCTVKIVYVYLLLRLKFLLPGKFVRHKTVLMRIVSKKKKKKSIGVSLQ